MALTRLDLGSPTILDGGRNFGQVGPYQRIDGTAYFSVDPEGEANSVVTDLCLAPRNSDGLVPFSADFSILQPVDPEKGSRRLLLDVLNRGGRTVLRFFNGYDQVAPPHAPIDPGNGFLMERGFTVVWCGWQHDVPDVRGLMRAHVPQALDSDGAPLVGKVAVTFQPAALMHTHPLSDRLHKPYSAASVDDPEAVLTVRDEEDSPRQTIPNEAWSFSSIVDGKLDPDHIYLESGFQPGKIYQAIYKTNYSPVVGLGLLATRDVVSHLRHSQSEGSNPCARNIDRAYAFGASQSGRFLREFLYLGLNADEEHRLVFDGVIPHIAGGRRGEFNQRYGQPSSMVRHSLGHTFPFTDSLQTDPEKGATDGLLARLKKGAAPKVFLTNSSSEYWRGDAALVHTDVEGAKDLEPSDDVRIYLLTGTQHSRGALFLTDSNPLDGIRAQHYFNTVDYGPLMRAMLVNLDSWVSFGTEPPPSRHPPARPRRPVGRKLPGAIVQFLPRNRISGQSVPTVPYGFRQRSQRRHSLRASSAHRQGLPISDAVRGFRRQRNVRNPAPGYKRAPGRIHRLEPASPGDRGPRPNTEANRVNSCISVNQSRPGSLQ